MRIIMMGTGPFAVPTLRQLYASPHEVLALVTRPARRAPGKTRAETNPMREVAIAAGTPVLEPESINTAEAREALAHFESDLFIVCDYGQILAPASLSAARLGGINLHASLLPKYRGAAPINWAIYHGETETGVTVIHMTPEVDAGPAIAQKRMPIGAEETAADVEPRLAELGAPLVLECVDQLATGKATAIAQDPALASRAPRLKKTDGLVDWHRTAEEIKNQVRAMEPWPKTFTFWKRGDENLRLILGRVAAISERAPAPPGTVVEATGRLVVATGGGSLEIQSVQPAGKRAMSSAEFLRGYPVRSGERFGEAQE